MQSHCVHEVYNQMLSRSTDQTFEKMMRLCSLAQAYLRNWNLLAQQDFPLIEFVLRETHDANTSEVTREAVEPVKTIINHMNCK